MTRCAKRLPVFLLLAAACAARAAETRDPSPPTPIVERPIDDHAAGARLAEVCAACHALERGGKDRWGPNLFGIVDRPVGAEAAYRYGPYLRSRHAAGDTWDEGSLRAWLVASKDIARAAGTRTKMPMQQLTDDELDALVGYLRTLR